MGLLTLKGRGFGQGLQGGWTQRTSYPGTRARHNGRGCAVPLCGVPGVASHKQQAAVPGLGREQFNVGRWQHSVGGPLCEGAGAPELCPQERLRWHSPCTGLWLTENQAQVAESRASPAPTPSSPPKLPRPPAPSTLVWASQQRRR